MLDKYFKAPLLFDYSIAGILVAITYYLYKKCILIIPKESFYVPITSDLTNISLTSAGFILTLLTVFLTFKSTANDKKENSTNTEANANPKSESKSTFQLFFATPLYFQTVKHLKNCIKSLIFISIVGFSLKLGLPEKYRIVLYFYNVLGLVVMVLTLWRCLLILSKILDMQKVENYNSNYMHE